jgi:hypothetical protein
MVSAIASVSIAMVFHFPKIRNYSTPVATSCDINDPNYPITITNPIPVPAMSSPQHQTNHRGGDGGHAGRQAVALPRPIVVVDLCYLPAINKAQQEWSYSSQQEWSYRRNKRFNLHKFTTNCGHLPRFLGFNVAFLSVWGLLYMVFNVKHFSRNEPLGPKTWGVINQNRGIIRYI